MDNETLNKIDSEILSTAAIVAEMAIQPISLDLQRKYLDIDGFSIEAKGIAKESDYSPEECNISWLEITQIGKPLDDSPETIFSAIQKILQACNSKCAKLLFLISSRRGTYTIHLGIKNGKEEDKIDINAFGEYAKGCWNGLKCHDVKTTVSDVFKTEVKDNIEVRAITGVPSMKSSYETFYSSTIDSLLSGMLNKEFYYLVIAEQVDREEIEKLIVNIRSMSGTMESLKSFDYSENQSVSEQQSQVFKPGLSNDEKKQASKKMLFKSIPFLGAYHSANYDEFLQNYLTPPTTVSSSKTINAKLINKHVEAVSEYLEKQIRRYENCEALGAWRTGVYVLSKNKSAADTAASLICSMSTGVDSYLEPIRKHNLNRLAANVREKFLGYFDNPPLRVCIKGEPYKNSFGNVLDGMNTVLSTAELSYFINFPLKSVPGISVIDSSPDFNLNSVEIKDGLSLGKQIFGGSETGLDYLIDPMALSRHALIAGINGSGKTNTIQRLLSEINSKINAKNPLPFLILEPAKTEYVDWAYKYNEENKAAIQKGEKPAVNIYIPGCQSYQGKFEPKSLKINPFEIVWLSEKNKPNVLGHIDRLKSVFASAFPMTDILPVLLEDLIYSIYMADTSNWIGKNADQKFGNPSFPTLNSMSYYVDTVMAKRKYEERVQMNMEACLNTRIDALKRGWRGEMLNNRKSIEWKELFEKPTVINLSYVGDSIDKSFIMSLVLQFLYEYRAAQAEQGEIDFNNNDCRHLTVIEEAHHVMMQCDNHELPQFHSAMQFSNMLSEIRAYGESVFLVDQVPTRLIPDAIKNTNLKIIHRLVAEDDCRAVGESMGLSDEQKKMISKLLTGQCIVSSSTDTNAYWVKVPKTK